MDKPRLRKPSATGERAAGGGGSANGSFSRGSAVQQLKLGLAFDPHSRGFQLWNQLLLLCFLAEMLVLPLAAAFPGGDGADGVSPVLPRVLYAAEALFLLDVYVRFNTGYYAHGNIHRDKRQARRNYVCSAGFLLDVAAAVPLALLVDARGVPWAWLEAHKLARAWRLPRYLASLDDLYAKRFMLLKLLKVLFATAFAAHVFACAKVLLAASTDADADVEAHPALAYAKALYWSLGLLTGELEGALPARNEELGLAIAVGFAGYALFVYLCATFFVLSKSERNQAMVAQARIDQLQHLLSFHRVPEALRDEAVDYVQRHYTDAESSDRGVVKLLCPSITKDIQVQLLQGMMARIPLFRGCNEQFIVALTSLLELTSYAARVTLFSAGDRGDYMYVVNSGVLHILVGGAKVRELRKGDFFGEVSVFSARARTATVATASYCTLYRLSRFHIERVLEGYPDYAALIAVMIDEIVNQRQAAMAQGKAAPAADDADFMLATLYQLSTKPAAPRKRRQSLLQPQQRPAGKKPSLHRSKSSQNMSVSRRDEDLDGGAADPLPDRPRAPRPAGTGPPRRKIVRSKSVLARRISSGLWGRRTPTGGSRADLAHPPPSLRGLHGRDSRAIQGFYDNLAQRMHAQAERQGAGPTALARKLLLRQGIDRASARRKWWLAALQLHLLLNWLCVPLLLALPELDALGGGVVAWYVTSDLLLLADAYLGLHLSYTTADQEKVLEPARTAAYYATHGLGLDLLCAFPFEVVLAFVHVERPALLRLPRLLRAWRLGGHMEEARRSFGAGNLCRLGLGVAAYLLALHLVACVHAAFSTPEGGARSVLGFDQGPRGRGSAAEQYAGSLYFAAATITTLGKYSQPEGAAQYAATLALMMGGFFATAVVVDSVQKRFTQSALEQKEFLIRRARIQAFLSSQVFPAVVHQRVNAFLDFWWFSHRGAIAGELLGELPDTIKRPVLRSMCQPALQTLSLLAGVREVLDDLERAFVDNLKFILYGQGEVVYRQGEYASGLYFLLEGEAFVIADGTVPRTLVKGGFTGSASLHLNETSVSYAERVTARSGCVMVFLSREHLDEMHKVFPTLSMALKALEKRLQGSKLTKPEEATAGPAGSRAVASGRESREARLLRRLGLEDLVFDPDEAPAAAWKAWGLFLTVAQSFKVILDLGFRAASEDQAASDAILVLVELFFLLDVYFHSRLGFYEYGNKVMDCRRIRARYLRSYQFAADVAALLPLFVANWAAPPARRQELVNANKLLRLARLPQTFRRLEQKHLSATLALRLSKLLLYCVILSHLVGCVWFSFGFADAAAGDKAWRAPASLANRSLGVQYLASLFWSFGVLSGSNLAVVPETPRQCIFTVAVLISGVLLFAFVVGHLSDVAELVTADTRAFNARLSSLRRLLRHFRLPAAIEDKLKTHYFFQRYHTITQEHVLEQCLPPSLLTEIRLVHLRPMITKVAFLAGMEGSVTRMLVAQFSQLLVVKDHFVFRYGEDGTDMYFIFTGMVDILVPAETLRRRLSGEFSQPALATPPGRAAFHSFFPATDASRPPRLAQMKKVNELSAGGYFGEVSLFTSNLRSAYARSKTPCVLYRLSRRSLELVFDRYPEWKKKVVKIVNIQQEQQHLKNLYLQEQQETSARASASASVDGADAGDTPHSNRVKSFAENLTTPSRPRRRRSSNVSSVGSVASSFGSFVGLAKQQQQQQLLLQGQRQHQQSVATGSKAIRLHPVAQKESALWIDRLLQCTEAQSAFHLRWLRLMCAATVFMAAAVPYRNAFDSLERLAPLPLAVRALEGVCELLFAWDIWINWNMRDSAASMELYERKVSRAYRRRRLWVDALAAFPVDHFLADFTSSPALRINRCAKLLNLPHYMSEISRRSVAYERTRLWTFGVLWLVLLHWCACAYFSVARAVGAGATEPDSSPRSPSDASWDSWAPPRELLVLPDAPAPASGTLARRFLRSLFFSVAVLFKRGRVFAPEDARALLFTIAAALAGFFLLAFLVSEAATLYVSYIHNEVDFRSTHVAVDHYLARWRIGPRLQARCHAFLSSLWSSHRGVDYRAIFDELLPVLRTESVLHIARKPLAAFAAGVFRPLATRHPQDRDVDALLHALAQQLTYQGYPRDESVVIEGSVSTEMYFIARGSLVSYACGRSADSRVDSRTVLATYGAGDYFGEEGLLGYSVVGATVRTVGACDLLALSSEALLQVLLSLPLFHAALGVAVASYRAVSRRSDSGEPVDWGDALLAALDRQRALWLDEARQQFAAGDASDEAAGEDAWKTTGVRGGQRVGLLALATPADCLQAFDRLVRLIVARGTQSDRVASAHSSGWYFPDSLPFLSAASSPTAAAPSATEASDASSGVLRTQPWLLQPPPRL